MSRFAKTRKNDRDSRSRAVTSVIVTMNKPPWPCRNRDQKKLVTPDTSRHLLVFITLFFSSFSVSVATYSQVCVILLIDKPMDPVARHKQHASFTEKNSETFY
jgi:hypothetical protein